MTSVQAQAIVVALSGVGLLFVITSLTRNGLLSLRYGLGWLTIALTMVVAAMSLSLVRPLAIKLHMTPTGLMLAGMSGFLLLVALQLSISVSGLQEAVRDLSEANALLEERLQETEASVDEHR